MRDVVNLSTTFFIQRFFTFFLFFIKNAFFNVFYSWGQRILHLWFKPDCYKNSSERTEAESVLGKDNETSVLDELRCVLNESHL